MLLSSFLPTPPPPCRDLACPSGPHARQRVHFPTVYWPHLQPTLNAVLPSFGRESSGSPGATIPLPPPVLCGDSVLFCLVGPVRPCLPAPPCLVFVCSASMRLLLASALAFTLDSFWASQPYAVLVLCVVCLVEWRPEACVCASAIRVQTQGLCRKCAASSLCRFPVSNSHVGAPVGWFVAGWCYEFTFTFTFTTT